MPYLHRSPGSIVAATADDNPWTGARVASTGVARHAIDVNETNDDDEDLLAANDRRRNGPDGWHAGDIVTKPGRIDEDVARHGDRRPYLTVLRGAIPGRLYRIRPGRTVLGRGNDCGFQVSDPSVSRHHLEFLLGRDEVTVNDLASTNGSLLNGERFDSRTLHDGDKLQVGPALVVRFNFKDVVDEQFERNQFDAMTRDGLTGCFNRLYFDTELARELMMSRTTGLPMAVAMVDLDHFKAVNDVWGHGAGDQLLQEVAQIIRYSLRAYDIVARYGGEEFAIVMRGTDLNVARACLDRVRESVAARRFAIGPSGVGLAVSIGVASSDEDANCDDAMLMTVADMRMYVAKRDGRNRVISDELPFNSARDTDDFAPLVPQRRSRELVVTLPRGRVRLRPLSELTEGDRARRITMDPAIRRKEPADDADE